MSLHHIIYKLTAVVAVLLMAACDDQRTFDRYVPVESQTWDSAEEVCFDVPRQAEGTYTMTLGLRQTTAYPYTNIAVAVETTVLPRHTVRRDTVRCTMNDGVGRPMGQHGVSVSERNAGICAFHLQQGDSLHIAVRHLMQRQDLPGVSDVGIRLEKE